MIVQNKTNTKVDIQNKYYYVTSDLFFELLAI